MNALRQNILSKKIHTHYIVHIWSKRKAKSKTLITKSKTTYRKKHKKKGKTKLGFSFTQLQFWLSDLFLIHSFLIRFHLNMHIACIQTHTHTYITEIYQWLCELQWRWNSLIKCNYIYIFTQWCYEYKYTLSIS